MYVPAAFQVDHRPTVFDFIEQYPFATLFNLAGGRPFATHLPFLLDRERELLLGHVSRRGNPHWRSWGGSAETLAIFHGPHAYISPNWYVNSPAVPTWNYAAVHAYGVPRIVESEELETIIDRLVARFESPRTDPWPNQLPADYRTKLLAGIVGFSLPILRLEGKFKFGQNRPPEDRAAMLAHLEAGDNDEQALARLIQAHAPPG